MNTPRFDGHNHDPDRELLRQMENIPIEHSPQTSTDPLAKLVENFQQARERVSENLATLQRDVETTAFEHTGAGIALGAKLQRTASQLRVLHMCESGCLRYASDRPIEPMFENFAKQLLGILQKAGEKFGENFVNEVEI